MNQATVHPTEPHDQTDPASERAATVVVGAGIGGLLAAITAADGASGRVVLLDPHPAGGRARTDDRGGFTFNRGPRALYVGGPADQALRAVGVDTSHGGPASLRDAIAVFGGQVHRFPGEPFDALRTSLFGPRQKVQVARTLGALWRATPRSTESRSLAEWLDERRIDGVVRQFTEALVRVASYANAPETFDAAPALANARAGVQPGVRYLDGGWQSLVDQLLAIAGARGVELVPEAARAVAPGPATTVVTTGSGRRWEATSVVLALGGPDAAAALLPARPASWGDLAPPVTAACLELGIRGLPTHRFALGIDEPLYGSTHAPPADLAPDGHAVVHLMRYQPVGDDVPAAEQRGRLERLARQMGIAADAVVEERFLSRMVVAGTLPHPATGGLAGRPAVEVAEHPGILLAGDWVGPTGLLLDAVASSAVAAGRRAAARSATMARA
ncbi:MAG: NAD(P)-binding protein [Aquihabitans sp.]